MGATAQPLHKSFIFFFQAEDGIRDRTVTGVQTCALPIFSNVLFGGPCKWGKRNYATFPREKFLETFERAAFDPANAHEELLVLMVKAYAITLGRSLDSIIRWVEKTPANRNHVNAIIGRFPNAK